MSPRELSLGAGSAVSKFTLTDTELTVERAADKKWPSVKTALRNVLWAGVDNGILEISLLAKKKSKSPFSLVHVTGPIAAADKEQASAFAEAVMDAAYAGLPRERRLKVFVCPYSGPGKAVGQYHKIIEPIFKAARCKVDLTFTTHRYHVQEVIEKLPLDQFDAVVPMSGDGLVHEILNGYATHAEPAKAFRLPISPIPAGSANGLCLNLIGLEDLKDITVAALSAIKGKSMDVDLFSFIQGGKRSITFMCQAAGVMADLDLGTEGLRLLGDHRFVLGYVYAILKHKPCNVKVSIKVAHSDKNKMIEDMLAAHSRGHAANGSAQPAAGDATSGLPELVHTGPNASKDGWVTFDKPLMYVFAGKGPHVARDFMQFPVSLPSDGFIDVVLQEHLPRIKMANAIDGAERGETFWMDTQHYFKAYAYRVEPNASKGYLSIDGESFPFEPYEVEVHQKLGCFLSMYGHYKFEFDTSRKAAK